MLIFNVNRTSQHLHYCFNFCIFQPWRNQSSGYRLCEMSVLVFYTAWVSSELFSFFPYCKQCCAKLPQVVMSVWICFCTRCTGIQGVSHCLKTVTEDQCIVLITSLRGYSVFLQKITFMDVSSSVFWWVSFWLFQWMSKRRLNTYLALRWCKLSQSVFHKSFACS